MNGIGIEARLSVILHQIQIEISLKDKKKIQVYWNIKQQILVYGCFNMTFFFLFFRSTLTKFIQLHFQEKCSSLVVCLLYLVRSNWIKWHWNCRREPIMSFSEFFAVPTDGLIEHLVTKGIQKIWLYSSLTNIT